MHPVARGVPNFYRPSSSGSRALAPEHNPSALDILIAVMTILFAIAFAAFCAMLLATLAIARHLGRGHAALTSSKTDTSRTDLLHPRPTR